jgi:RimJ/RimL family protein N-acetyltransferase
MNGHTLTDGVVILAPLTAEDATEWLAGQDEEQVRWFELARQEQLSDAQCFISERMESWRTMENHRHWGIQFVDSRTLLGGVEVRPVGDSEVNLSYVVFPPFRQRGVARRASLLALSYAADTMGAETAVIRILLGNEFSMKLAKSLGATYAGEEPSYAGDTFKVFRLSLGTSCASDSSHD